MIEVDPNDTKAIIREQKEWLRCLQNLNTKKPILIKVKEGGIPKDENGELKDDPDLYNWVFFSDVWRKVHVPIYTRGIQPNEILIDPDAPDWEAVRDGINKICEYCKKEGIPTIKGFSGGKGIHVSIFFERVSIIPKQMKEYERLGIDVDKISRRALCLYIARKAGVDLDKIGIDWGKINFKRGKRGSQVRTFGTTRAEGKYKTLVDKIPDKKPEAGELPLIFPEKIEIWTIPEEFRKEVYRFLEIELGKASRAEENEIKLKDTDFKGIGIFKFPCIQKLFSAGVTNGRYYAGLSVLLMCEKCGISKEETEKQMRELFKTFPGITQEETDLRINNALTMYGSGGHFSCRKVIETFGEDFCNFYKCPIKDKINEERKKQEKEEEKKKEEIKLPFNMVAERILGRYNIFTMEDTKEIYIYRDGVYRSEGSKSFLDRLVRDDFKNWFCEQWDELYPDHEPEFVPAAKTGYVNEVMNYIHAYRYKHRNLIMGGNENKINLLNGIYNISTGKLEPHTPDEIFINQIPVKYDPSAKCPNVNKFLSEVLDSEEDITVLIEWMGYLLTTDTRQQKAMMLLGSGSNGKSVFLNFATDFLGKENCSSEPMHKLEEDKFSVANLYGKRVNVFADLPATPLYKNDTFNMLVGNDQLLRGEKKFCDTFQFKNLARMMYSANRLPYATSDNYAYYRRWIIIKFPKTFTEDEINKNLEEVLQTDEEKSGFLNLALEGLKTLSENGRFSYSKTVEEVEDIYLKNSDPVVSFTRSCLKASTEDTPKHIIYEAYVNFSKVNGIKNITPLNKFGQRMKKIGYTDARPYLMVNGKQKKVSHWENCVISKSYTSQQKISENSDIFQGMPDLLQRDLKNFSKTEYHNIVEDIESFVRSFFIKYPGYKEGCRDTDIVELAKILNKRGWK